MSQHSREISLVAILWIQLFVCFSTMLRDNTLLASTIATALCCLFYVMYACIYNIVLRDVDSETRTEVNSVLGEILIQNDGWSVVDKIRIGNSMVSIAGEGKGTSASSEQLELFAQLLLDSAKYVEMAFKAAGVVLNNGASASPPPVQQLMEIYLEGGPRKAFSLSIYCSSIDNGEQGLIYVDFEDWQIIEAGWIH